MRRLGNRGMGFIGIVVVLVLMMFFFAGFYVTLEVIYSNLASQLTSSADTLTYYNDYIRPMWLSLSFFFLLSIIIWGLVQTQSPFNMASIAVVWVVIIFGYFAYSILFVAFDEWIMSLLPALLTVDANYVSVYENLVKSLWRVGPFAAYGVLVFFGLYMASTYAERAGNLQSYNYGGGRF